MSADLDKLMEYLLMQPMARISPSGRELSMRCPICGDSIKSDTSTNFSINIDPSSDRFLSWQCFRASCQARGTVDSDFLDQLGIFEPEMIAGLNKSIKRSKKEFKRKRKKDISNVINTDDIISKKKLEYINNRLGLDLSFKDIYDLKINLNLNELMRMNNIEIPHNKTYYYDNLSNYGLSFISAYNDYVIIRDISKSGKLKKKYTNINLFDNYDNVTKIYTIPTEIDLLSPEPTVLNITEGAFDILGVYYHTKIDRKYKNQIYAAACGANINNTIKEFIKQYGLINLKINIFSDADVPRERYNELYKLREYLYDFNVCIYYNELEKDMGVSKDRIRLIRSKL